MDIFVRLYIFVFTMFTMSSLGILDKTCTIGMDFAHF